MLLFEETEVSIESNLRDIFFVQDYFNIIHKYSMLAWFKYLCIDFNCVVP